MDLEELDCDVVMGSNGWK